MIIPIGIMFLWNANIDVSQQIIHEKFGTFGDFVGGILGSIWALCGVILFYLALVEQREDFKTNKGAFEKQITALEVQTQEFKLQRNELAETRKISIEQSKTLKQQRLESTYFALLGIYDKIRSSLDEQGDDGNYFKKFREDLVSTFAADDDPVLCHDNAQDNYLLWFYKKKEDLSHYYKTVYRIIRIIDDSEIGQPEKMQYIKILRSQMSENEMLALYYNSHSVYGENFYVDILKYNLLKHLPSLSKTEFQAFVTDEKCLPALLRFNNLVDRIIEAFIRQLGENLIKDGIENTAIEYDLAGFEGILFRIEAAESNLISVSVALVSNECGIGVLGFSEDTFVNYLSLYLYDMFFFSTYKKIDEKYEVSRVNCEEKDCIKFRIYSTRKLLVNRDGE